MACGTVDGYRPSMSVWIHGGHAGRLGQHRLVERKPRTMRNTKTRRARKTTMHGDNEGNSNDHKVLPGDGILRQEGMWVHRHRCKKNLVRTARRPRWLDTSHNPLAETVSTRVPEATRPRAPLAPIHAGICAEKHAELTLVRSTVCAWGRTRRCTPARLLCLVRGSWC